jgi:hypothetical protein
MPEIDTYKMRNQVAVKHSVMNKLLVICKPGFIDGICDTRIRSEPVTVSDDYLFNINATCVLVIICAKTQGALR